MIGPTGVTAETSCDYLLILFHLLKFQTEAYPGPEIWFKPKTGLNELRF